MTAGFESEFIQALASHVAGKRVLITGGSSGIGLAMSEALAPLGARLILVARTESKLLDAQKAVEALGGHAHIYSADLSDEASAQAMIDAVIADHGGVDILINNAARSIRRSVVDSFDRLHDYRRTMELNYLGPMRLILAFAPGMREQRAGIIINVLTMGCQVRSPRFSAYLGSKCALDAATRCIATEVNHEGIQITQVYLPLVRTPMIAPTKLYEKMPALSVERAAYHCLEGIVTGKPRVSMPLGVFFEAMHAFAPERALKILSDAYLKPPGSERNPSRARKMVGKFFNRLSLGEKRYRAPTRSE